MKPIPRLADDMRIYLATEKMENQEILETLLESRGQTVKLAYVDQQHKSIDPEKTVYEVISGGADLITLGNRQVNARAYVG
ncbi:MAG: hypothetical protein IIX33_03300, partial [Oscillospiraceae bacterium]|nr:hypothetical protein [Oscillospiraceae bacterium]